MSKGTEDSDKRATGDEIKEKEQRKGGGDGRGKSCKIQGWSGELFVVAELVSAAKGSFYNGVVMSNRNEIFKVGSPYMGALAHHMGGDT